ncbi:hypothetical protein LI90_1558 [Carbonactinospora thermoautotrophica]|uniref:N,N-dimethylformamidase beta subunit-like C-terminal domain-containing protein n=2 Tax=Carbonactinospora thermoautotrophica TaxID=1469144 RepID=A0A132MPZ6_9ACTN|nr:N,N-dimethylformamidase beta subunit family domain-containing protein [Carbonactinospora thermoautotrophica]KWW99918.1 hypothetical protein LI90_1558 [Carbonactinospora thermoautotrophica]
MSQTGFVGRVARAALRRIGLNDPTRGPLPDPASRPEPVPDLSHLRGPLRVEPGDPGLIRKENAAPGTNAYRRPYSGRDKLVSDDVIGQVKAYVSATSVAAGESIAFHVSVNPPQPYRIAVYRLGYYRGAGGRLMTESVHLAGRTQPACAVERYTGLVTCDWEADWRLEIPETWVSGVYLAVFTNEQGYQTVAPFVVRDELRRADLLCVLPFSTYQAYNDYPRGTVKGKSLCHGFTAGGCALGTRRAVKVSFDRPYAANGWPTRFQDDLDFIAWAEELGYDLTYASSVDLHAGRVDPRRYRAIVFSGRDEYWSDNMRAVAELAVAGGTHLAFLSAANVYWRIRFECSRDGRPHRTMACYKEYRDPDSRTRTHQWRRVGRPEQELVGVQCVSKVSGRYPLVIRDADHWFWAGIGARDGDRIDKLVEVEADQRMPRYALPAARESVLLAESPYLDERGRKRLQHTSLYQAESGAWVFAAGTFGWTKGLSHRGFVDPRVRGATQNLFARFLAD